MKLLAALLALIATTANARDMGQWESADPVVKHWYSTLKQPDWPTASCCGVGDAYWADSFEVSPDGRYIAIITDDRDDGPLVRDHIDIGTKLSIPPGKIVTGKGNPTGHGIVFVSWGIVWCYLPPGGV